MNSFIVSQWYKNREELKEHYNSNFFDPVKEPGNHGKLEVLGLCSKCDNGKNGFCDVCLKNTDGHYSEANMEFCIANIQDMLIRNLLTYVINRGEDNPELSFVDQSSQLVGGFSG